MIDMIIKTANFICRKCDIEEERKYETPVRFTYKAGDKPKKLNVECNTCGNLMDKKIEWTGATSFNGSGFYSTDTKRGY
jgi:hypothetical protein